MENLNLKSGTNIQLEQSGNDLSINNIITYSTTEKVVGTWLNGKPLYQKTFEYTSTVKIGNATSTTDIQINHGVENLSNIIQMNMSDNTNSIYPLLYNNSTASIVGYTNTQLDFKLVNMELTARTFYITITYTKTTD